MSEDSLLHNLLRGAVHDVRGPLNQVQALTGMLVAKHGNALDEDGRQLCEFIEQAAARAGSVVDAIHAYAMVLRAPQRMAADMNEVFNRARNELAVEIESRNGVVEAEELGTTCVDSGMVRQLFRELIANGLKFNAEPRVEIRIRASRQGEWMVYTVADNGIGIPPERSDAVFQPFKRLNGFEYAGAGMGLAIAKHIAEAHGGWIRVEAPGTAGAEVRFALPRCASA